MIKDVEVVALVQVMMKKMELKEIEFLNRSTKINVAKIKHVVNKKQNNNKSSEE